MHMVSLSLTIQHSRKQRVSISETVRCHVISFARRMATWFRRMRQWKFIRCLNRVRFKNDRLSSNSRVLRHSVPCGSLARIEKADHADDDQ